MRRFTTFLALTASLLVAACGSSGPSTTPLSIVRLSSGKTVEAKTARLAMTLDFPKELGVGNASFTGDGLIDFARNQGSLTMKMGLGTGDFMMEMRFFGSIVYVKLPEGIDPAGKPWIKLDTAKLSELAGIPNLEQLQQVSTNDPTMAVNFFRGASEVKELGKEDVRGEATTHYSATLDLDKALADAPAEVRSKMKSFLDGMDISDIPAEAWVDSKGRLRKISVSYDISKSPQAASLDLKGPAIFTMHVEIYDFGTAVSIDEPRAGEVTDFTEFLQGQGAGAGSDTELGRLVLRAAEAPKGTVAIPGLGSMSAREYFDGFSSGPAEEAALTSAGLEEAFLVAFANPEMIQADTPPPGSVVVQSAALKFTSEEGAKAAAAFERKDAKDQLSGATDSKVSGFGSEAYFIRGKVSDPDGMLGGLIWRVGDVVLMLAVTRTGPVTESEVIALAKKVHARA